MDLSLYNLHCQKAFHKALQLAQAYGHQFMEVEHVSLALINLKLVELDIGVSARLIRELEIFLEKNQKVYGKVSPKFGSRLDLALDKAEFKLGIDGKVDLSILWEALKNQSSVLKMFFLKERELSSKSTIVNEKTEVDDQKNSHAMLEKGSDQNQNKLNQKHQKVLDQYTTDLNLQAEKGLIDPVIGRDSEVKRVLEILGRKKKNNPVLIGEAGVGKTAVAEAVALRIVAKQVPETITNKRLIALDIGSLLAGAKYRGEIEERLKDLLDAIKSHEDKLILFIDEVHMIVGTGGAEGTSDIANLLKPELARGRVRCLGATTSDEYRKFIEKDPALERRFQPVSVEEPTPAVTLSIMRGLKSKYETHHGVMIEDQALIAAVEMAKRYLPFRKFPDKAIDIMDEACSRVRYQIDSMPSIMEELKSKISNLELEKQAISAEQENMRAVTILNLNLEKVKSEYSIVEKIWREYQLLMEELRNEEKKRNENIDILETAKQSGNYDLAAKIQYSELPSLVKKLDALKIRLQTLQGQYSWLKLEVNKAQIAEVVALWSKIPVQKIADEEVSKIKSLDSRLKARVFGQDEAIALVSKAVKRARTGINDANRPLGVFLFCGPTGVGKTETVKALAGELFDSENKLIRIDMSEYMEKHNVSRLIGSPPGYVGHGEGGELTEAIRRNPFSVVLFDEIEKAHPRVLDILLQVFEDGRLTDGEGRTVDFKNALVVLTSNLPIERVEYGSDLEKDEIIRRELSNHLRPEFVNRLDEIVVFKSIGKSHLKMLIDRLVNGLNEKLLDRGVRVVMSEAITKKMIDSVYHGQFGGRAMRRVFQNLIVDSLAEKFLDENNSLKGVYIADFFEERVVWLKDSLEQRLISQKATAS